MSLMAKQLSCVSVSQVGVGRWEVWPVTTTETQRKAGGVGRGRNFHSGHQVEEGQLLYCEESRPIHLFYGRAAPFPHANMPWTHLPSESAAPCCTPALASEMSWRQQRSGSSLVGMGRGREGERKKSSGLVGIGIKMG